MSDTNKTYWTDDPELVEKYVFGQLSDKERLRLDAEIADCEPCKQKLRHELEMAAGIRRYGRDSLKAKLHAKLRRKQSNQLQQFQFIGLAAAVIIIAIGAGVYKIWFNDFVFPKKFNNKQIILVQPEQPKETAKAEDSQGEEEANKKDAERTAVEKSDGSSSKDIAESKPSRANAERRTKSASAELKKKKMSVHSELAMSDEVTTMKEATGAPAIKQSAAGAVSSSEEVKVESGPSKVYKEQTIWLIGKVEMVSDMAMQNAAKVAPRELQSEQFIAREESAQKKSIQRKSSQSRTVTVKRSGEEEQIVLQQRSFRELPVKRQTQLGKESHVETLLKQSKNGNLSLTIFSDAFTEDDLESATVETVRDDSLIISTASQRIYYRLPEELSETRRSRR